MASGATMQCKDHYQVLGVARSVGAADIKKAYRKQARRFHPDINTSCTATQSMADINAAHAVLGDALKRAAYDALTAPRSTAPAQARHANSQATSRSSGWAEFFPFADGTPEPGAAGKHSDFFEHLFGNAAQARSSGNAPVRGRDLHAGITLDLLDSYHGAQKTVSLRGVDSEAACAPLTELHVIVPKGVFEGQKIRLAGCGSAGRGGGARGDLLLEVRFKPDALWRVKGRDVYGHLPLAPRNAALSPWLVVRTPAGVAEVKIPSDWKAGSSLRLKGYGIPGSSSSGLAHKAAGDLYLELCVAPSPAENSKAREAYAAMGRAFAGFQPRWGKGA